MVENGRYEVINSGVVRSDADIVAISGIVGSDGGAVVDASIVDNGIYEVVNFGVVGGDVEAVVISSVVGSDGDIVVISDVIGNDREAIH